MRGWMLSRGGWAFSDGSGVDIYLLLIVLRTYTSIAGFESSTISELCPILAAAGGEGRIYNTYML
jgi:hypothetical protein